MTLHCHLRIKGGLSLLPLELAYCDAEEDLDGHGAPWYYIV